MRLGLAVGVAAAGLAFSALAHEMPRIDTNEDGWVSRAEASATAERVFRDMDSNDDGKLDRSDRRGDHVFEYRLEGGGEGHAVHRIERHEERQEVERNVIIRRDHDSHSEHDVPPPPGVPPIAPVPPLPPHPPMFMMLIANSEEADLNGDDALSLEEFRAQHLRFFDASDANGDGRIRFTPPEMPVPPEPPMAPLPPQPPR